MRKALVYSLVFHGAVVLALLMKSPRTISIVEPSYAIVDLMELAPVGSPEPTPWTQQFPSAGPEKPVAGAQIQNSAVLKTRQGQAQGESFSSESYMEKLKQRLAATSKVTGKTISGAPEQSGEATIGASTRASTSLASRIFPFKTVDAQSKGKTLDVSFPGLRIGEGIPAEYVSLVRSVIQKNWKISANESNFLTAVVSFRLLSDGSVSDLTLEKSSGRKSFDECAMEAVRDVKQFPPIPVAVTQKYLDFEIHFTVRGVE